MPAKSFSFPFCVFSTFPESFHWVEFCNSNVVHAFLSKFMVQQTLWLVLSIRDCPFHKVWISSVVRISIVLSFFYGKTKTLACGRFSLSPTLKVPLPFVFILMWKCGVQAGLGPGLVVSCFPHWLARFALFALDTHRYSLHTKRKVSPCTLGFKNKC